MEDSVMVLGRVTCCIQLIRIFHPWDRKIAIGPLITSALAAPARYPPATPNNSSPSPYQHL